MMKTKFVAFVMAVIMCFSIATVSVFADSALLYGDSNLDSKVSILDATTIQLHLAKKLQLQEKAEKLSDVNGDKNITILDATII